MEPEQNSETSEPTEPEKNSEPSPPMVQWEAPDGEIHTTPIDQMPEDAKPL